MSYSNPMHHSDSVNKSSNLPIEDMIATAVRRGFAKAALRTTDFIFKAAPATGSNPGSVYVTANNMNKDYLGKIKDGQIRLIHDAQKYYSLILDVAMHPAEEALKYGQQTGICSICGRGLVAKESVKYAIGPICAEKVGLAFINPAEADKLASETILKAMKDML